MASTGFYKAPHEHRGRDARGTPRGSTSPLPGGQRPAPCLHPCASGRLSPRHGTRTPAARQDADFLTQGKGRARDRQAVYRGADAGPSAPSPALGDRVALQPRSGRRAGDSRPRSGTRASRRASLSGAPRRGAGAVLESFTSPARGRRPSPPPRTRAQRDPGCADVRLRLNLGRRRCGLV